MRRGKRMAIFGGLVLLLSGCGDRGTGGSPSNNAPSNNTTATNNDPANAMTNNGSTNNGSTNNGSTNNNPATNNTVVDPTDPCGELDCMSWCDEATWPSGEVPDETTDVVLGDGQVVVVDCEATAARVEIEVGATLLASRTASSILTVHGNVVVHGTLDYGTTTTHIPDGVTAELVIVAENDELFAGTPSTEFGSERGPTALTPMQVLESDPGVWVTGTLRAAGVPKKAWSRLVEGAGPGDATFTVEDSTGWRVGDRVVLTPTATLGEGGGTDEFDEGVIASVDGTTVTLQEAPQFMHAGCVDCVRRGEVINLTRNVVIRSADDSAHGHIMVFDSGVVDLDSAELRWLGPEQCGGPDRRAALYFHQQEDASRGSSVRRTSIWGGDRHFIALERSDGVLIEDVAGYDTQDSGFVLHLDHSACGTRCTDRESAPNDVVFRDVIAAKVGVATREAGCLRIQHRMAGFTLGGHENTGCDGCVATGVGYNGSGADIAGFQWPEGGGRPATFTFAGNVAHNNNGHGLFIWHNGAEKQQPYVDNAVWSNQNHGIHWGAYSNAYVLQNFTAVDNGVASIGVKAVPQDGDPRLDGGTIDDIRILSYVLVQETPNVMKDMVFTGDQPIGVTQIEEQCTTGDPTDPDDPDCLRVWLRFDDPVFPAGMVPFVFGESINNHAVWEVRGFSSPDYPTLPANFDLYHRTNEVAGGSYHEDFDAWLVPQ